MNSKKPYDYLIVGAGLFGATFAHEAHKAGKRCLVVDKRLQTGGNLHCRDIDSIQVHEYGAHIFHTDKREVWEYVNQLDYIVRQYAALRGWEATACSAFVQKALEKFERRRALRHRLLRRKQK